MKLDFNKAILKLDGQDHPGSNMGKLLADVLVSQAKGDPFKFYEWARSMYAGEVIDLDTSDQKTLQEFIKNTEQLSILAKAQMLEVFEKK